MIKSSAESCAECGSVLRRTEKFCPSCGNCVSADDTSDEIVLDMTLPISLGYPEAINVNIDNPSAVKTSRADLEFYPYYVIEYKIDIQRIDPSGNKHNLQNHEIVIVDASNAELLSDTKRMMEFVSKLNPFTSANKKDLVHGGIIERNQIIHDLKNVEPIRDHRLLLTSDYGINIIDNKISLTVAEKTVMQDVIIRNSKEVSYRIRKRKGKTEERKLQIVPKRHEIEIRRKSLVYVPKWKISFRSGDFEYKRTALAASCIFTADEIALCSMHSSLAKIWNRHKRTIAVCEICGGAFCNDHIFRINQMYYCKDHLPSRQVNVNEP